MVEDISLGKRLAYWANQLSRDKSFPWAGTGVIDDLKRAAKSHGADFDALYPLVVQTQPKKPEPIPVDEPEDWEKQFEPEEYDL